MNRIHQQQYEDAEIETRIQQYEIAFRMQASVPELTDFSKEPSHIFDLYGADARKPGTYAANCLRRLVERGVRFVQLFHRDWDHHAGLPKELPNVCRETDQASAALVKDLKQRGLLDHTLVESRRLLNRTIHVRIRTPNSRPIDNLQENVLTLDSTFDTVLTRSAGRWFQGRKEDGFCNACDYVAGVRAPQLRLSGHHPYDRR